jgi:uncharacterized DUF497 family protein
MTEERALPVIASQRAARMRAHDRLRDEAIHASPSLRAQRRSPDGAQRNPGLKLTQLRPRISLRSIRATKVTFGFLCFFRGSHGVTWRGLRPFSGSAKHATALVIEFDDLDATGELRFNAIGLVDGRMLFVTYTMRGEVARIISARGAEPHEKRKYHEI